MPFCHIVKEELYENCLHQRKMENYPYYGGKKLDILFCVSKRILLFYSCKKRRLIAMCFIEEDNREIDLLCVCA